jgi:hypothetical protein
VPGGAATLCDLTGKNEAETVKMQILATVKRKFAVEKDSWEIVADKGMVFVKNVLEGIGAGNGTLIDRLIADAEGLF